jgi:F0F1-type ATP synthase delta subunit
MSNLDILNQSLLSTLVTHTDAKRFIESLDEAIANTFTTKETLELLFSRLFSHDQKTVLLELMASAGVTQKEAIAVEKLLMGIRATVAKVPVLEMTVAVEPSERGLFRIKEWIDTHSFTKVFLEIKVNPRIIGGVRIAFNGKYSDYTVKKTIVEKL